VLLAELSLAFITGVWVSTVLSVPTFVVVAVGAVCAGSAWFRRRRHTWVWWLIVGAFALGIARHAGTKSHPGVHDIAHYTGRTVQMVGSVSSEPDVRDTGVSYLVSVDHLITGGVPEIVSGKVRVRVSRSVEWGYGDRLTLRARLDPAISLPPDVAGVMQFPHVLTRLPESRGQHQRLASRARGGAVDCRGHRRSHRCPGGFGEAADRIGANPRYCNFGHQGRARGGHALPTVGLNGTPARCPCLSRKRHRRVRRRDRLYSCRPPLGVDVGPRAHCGLPGT